MTQDTEKQSTSFLESKFWKVVLVLLAAVLMFGGPTYAQYAVGLALGYFAAIAVGGVLFVAGLVLLLFLVRKKVIT
jgi:hypothetical protein